MPSNGFDDVSPQLAAELIDHAGDPRPACVIGVRSDGLIDLAGGLSTAVPFILIVDWPGWLC